MVWMSPPLYRCGHPRTPENTWGKVAPRCSTCKRAQKVAERHSGTPEERRLEYRVRYLPTALKHAREKLRDLVDEARSLGLHDLLDEPRRLTGNQILTNTDHVDRAWEREAEIARIQARL